MTFAVFAPPVQCHNFACVYNLCSWDGKRCPRTHFHRHRSFRWAEVGEWSSEGCLLRLSRSFTDIDRVGKLSLRRHCRRSHGWRMIPGFQTSSCEDGFCVSAEKDALQSRLWLGT